MILTRTGGVTTPLWPPPGPELEPIGAREEGLTCWQVQERGLAASGLGYLARPARREAIAYAQSTCLPARCAPNSFGTGDSQGWTIAI